MSRMTIDFGIDLGTTNSSIAVRNGAALEIIKNEASMEYTPSAVYMKRNNSLLVGQSAKEQIEQDPENAFCEFKLQMGTAQEYRFARSGLSMRPEELSAEVLKSLKSDVQKRLGEDLQAAVITVPAAFELPQCEATKKSAQLAGLALSPLVQEPVAAAMAYGFQSDKDNVFWLVYDFGGGTFDAAVIQVRDGVIQVVNHGGDNHLGGKLIDWEIVEQVFVPALKKDQLLSDFRRGNAKWRRAFQKLKLLAEKAKIDLSGTDSVEAQDHALCQDDRGEPVDFYCEIHRRDVERIIEPFLLRSLNICRKVLSERRLGPGDIEKVLLVGGPTLTPYLRERIKARVGDGLGIELEYKIDPLTVVARGAAAFAGTQRLEGISPVPPKTGEYRVELDYKAVAYDPEPMIGGRVWPGPTAVPLGSVVEGQSSPEGSALSGFTIEFINTACRPQWASGKVGLGPDGSFITQLWAQKGLTNTFEIRLRDRAGSVLPAAPSNFTYTIGIVMTDPPLIHSVGVALANNEVELFFEKGTPLPERKRITLRTAVGVRRGEESDVLPVPVVEGEYTRKADRNRLIGALAVKGRDLKRDIPIGSEVEVTIEIDRSRLVTARAYVPILDQDFENVLPLEKKRLTQDELQRSARREEARLDGARKKAAAVGDQKAQEAIQRIDGEHMVHEIDTALEAAQNDGDAADKCNNRLTDLKIAIDEIEDALEWPGLVAAAEKEISNSHTIIDQHGKNADKQAMATLEKEIRKAIEVREPDVLRRKTSELTGLRLRVSREQPGWWVYWLDELEKIKSSMTNRVEAEQWIAQGRRSINNNDVQALKTAVQQLAALLPFVQRQEIEAGFNSGLHRGAGA